MDLTGHFIDSFDLLKAFLLKRHNKRLFDDANQGFPGQQGQGHTQVADDRVRFTRRSGRL